jgi:hypothetical protein
VLDVERTLIGGIGAAFKPAFGDSLKSQKSVKLKNQSRYLNNFRAEYRIKSDLSNELIFITTH